MINEKENPVAWAMLLTELDEAREHLDALINQISEAGAINEESEFPVYLGLNRPGFPGHLCASE